MNMKQVRIIRARRQSGFTLIELIVVIVILGILAATALPKFADLGKDARSASLNAVKGSILSMASLVHGKYLVGAVSATTVALEGTTVNLTTPIVTGYPKADNTVAAASGLSIAGAGVTGDYAYIAPSSAVGNGPATTATEVAFVPVSVSSTSAGATCYVKYAEPTVTNTAPVVTVVTTGC